MPDWSHHLGRKYWSRRDGGGKWTSGSAGSVLSRIMSKASDLKLPTIKGNHSAVEMKKLRSQRRSLATKMLNNGHTVESVRKAFDKEPKDWPKSSDIKPNVKTAKNFKLPGDGKAVELKKNSFGPLRDSSSPKPGSDSSSKDVKKELDRLKATLPEGASEGAMVDALKRKNPTLASKIDATDPPVEKVVELKKPDLSKLSTDPELAKAQKAIIEAIYESDDPHRTYLEVQAPAGKVYWKMDSFLKDAFGDDLDKITMKRGGLAGGRDNPKWKDFHTKVTAMAEDPKATSADVYNLLNSVDEKDHPEMVKALNDAKATNSFFSVVDRIIPTRRVVEQQNAFLQSSEEFKKSELFSQAMESLKLGETSFLDHINGSTFSFLDRQRMREAIFSEWGSLSKENQAKLLNRISNTFEHGKGFPPLDSKKSKTMVTKVNQALKDGASGENLDQEVARWVNLINGKKPTGGGLVKPDDDRVVAQSWDYRGKVIKTFQPNASAFGALLDPMKVKDLHGSLEPIELPKLSEDYIKAMKSSNPGKHRSLQERISLLTSEASKKAFDALPGEQKIALAKLSFDEETLVRNAPANTTLSTSTDVEPVPGNLTATDRKTLKHYTQASGKYNTDLRVGGYDKLNLTEKGRVDKMDSAMEKGKFTKDQTLVRGVSITNHQAAAWGLGFRELSDNPFEAMKGLVGKSFQDDGYMSTAFQAPGSQSGYAGFASANNKTINFRITAPKGSHGVNVASFSQYKNEREVVLDRGSKMVITGVHNDNGVIWVDSVVVSSNQTRKES